MTMPPAERVFLDTNVLLAATDEDRGSHGDALVALNERPSTGSTLYLSGQILREYLVVATRPVGANGLGLSRPDALANAQAFTERATLLEETAAVAMSLRQLVATRRVSGKRIHDANVVATMATHGVRALLTENVDDFTGFPEIEVVPLA